ncbi:MAG: DUF1207 domain-containing protein [Gemmatimonadales bacterium]|nr:DUF1207 domain-containing protein [Gemmatimonadales bacterium]NIN11311.1 DUF1207 domain-containing protein [Gemmatimonadales bacterium]NIN49910.1 DUF1207 domain-containing protein [Gemmatimonadales bacterium]NIP07374.1 DUF1207 domain-containing protein [Gemmatimonadales bacterium]NIR03069.1 DUF1207 domain-containing protein [Gemmatimonadales bacterium]
MIRFPRAVIVGLAAWVGVAQPEPLAAQTGWRLLPDRSLLPKLVAGPREPATAAKLVFVANSPTRFGEVLEGEAAIGGSLPAYLLAGQTQQDGLVVGVEGGVFARFNMETKERDLIATDWIFAVPLVLHRGEHWFRLRYYHTSAHMGDEYLERFELQRVDFARDELEALAYVRIGSGLGVYGGGGWAFRVDPTGAKRLTVRGGAELEALALLGPLRPYAAADVQLEQDNDWEPRLNLQAGLRFLPFNGQRGVRIAIELLTGPSPQGQFHGDRTAFIALGMFLDL